MKTIQYAHPDNHDLTWSGKGRRPKWFIAYVAQGGLFSTASNAAQAINRGVVTVTKIQPTITQEQLPGLPPLPKKRGRPVTGHAMTAAQRKRESRIRASTAIYAPADEGGQALTEVALSALVEQYATLMASRRHGMAALVAAELLRRAECSGADRK